MSRRRAPGCPDPIGGIFWFGVDDTYSTVYFPVYCGVTDVPKNYAVGTGSFEEFTWDSAWWVFNWVANFAYSRYSEMIVDIQVVQGELEHQFMSEVKEIDSAALVLHKESPRLAKDYLTEYTKKTGDDVVARWRKLGEHLLYKYVDGNLKTELGEVTHPGYPKSWYEKVAAATGDQLRVSKLEAEKKAEEEAKLKAEQTAESLLTLPRGARYRGGRGGARPDHEVRGKRPSSRSGSCGRRRRRQRKKYSATSRVRCQPGSAGP